MYNPDQDKNKPPYQARLLTMLLLALPSILLSWMFYAVMMFWQGRYGHKINFASAKLFGCGLGALFHCACWLFGAFKDSFQIVKNRLKEFFTDLFLSPKLAFSGYLDDLRTNGAAFLLDIAVVLVNFWVGIDALLDFITLRGL